MTAPLSRILWSQAPQPAVCTLACGHRITHRVGELCRAKRAHRCPSCAGVPAPNFAGVLSTTNTAERSRALNVVDLDRARRTLAR